jgi:catechol 2,3-dioxygenase-like lactoylglutathione lyase family enzyme
MPNTMITYVTLGVSDMARSKTFYEAVLGTLGIPTAEGDDQFMGWGPDYDGGVSLWLSKPFNGQPPTPGNGTMVAFRSASTEEVHAFHAAALAHGGSSEGEPGLRPNYSPNFYACYIRDPDGNKLACVFHNYGLKS